MAIGKKEKEEKPRRFAGHSTFHKDSKRTKKFKHKHLQDEIEKRKKIQLIKGRKKKRENFQEEEEEEDQEFQYDQETASEKKDEKFLKEDSDDEEEEEEEEGEEEEEDLEEDEEDGADAISQDFKKHKKELEELKKNDPDFVKFLKENDSSLLDFGREGDEGEEGEENEEEEEEDNEEGVTMLTNSMINSMIKGAKDGQLKELKRLMVAFRCGCYSTKSTTKTGHETVLPFEIAGDKTFSHLMITVLKNANYLFQLFDGSSNKNWSRMERIVTSFFANISHYIATCASDESLSLVLNQLESYITWLPKLKTIVPKKLLKVLMNRWSEHPEENVKASAFKIIRTMASKVPYPFINSCFRGIYLSYVKESKFYNPSTQKRIEFMAECVVELYLLDPIIAYQHVFVYIRQLAIHLRNFVQNQTKEALSHVYSWQFINSIRVWSMLLARHSSTASLGKEKVNLNQLIFPLVQVLLGTIRANGSPRYYSLRFICIEFINNIVTSSQSLVNTSSFILEVLGCADLKKKAKGVGSKLNFEGQLKASKSQRASSSFQDFLIGKVQSSLLQYFSIHSTSIAFPEMIIPVVSHLKKFNKKCTVPHWKRKITQVIEQLEKNSKYVLNHRVQIDFSPKTYEKTKTFLTGAKTPLLQYYKQLKSSEDQIKQLKKYDYEEEKDLSSSDEEGNEEVASEGEEEKPVKKAPPKPANKRKAEAPKRSTKKQARGGEGKKEDVVEDFEFSDDE